MKKQFINTIKVGDFVDDVFVLSKKNLAQKRDGNNFLNITLSDRTGSINGVVWDEVEQIIENITSGSFVHINGNVNEYRETLQLVVKKMTQCPVDSIDPSDYLPATDRNIDNMFNRLKKITASIKKEYLRELIEAFWSDEKFAEKFKKAPAAKKMHHAYIGGLLEHTLSMAILVDRIAGHYSGIDIDILLAGVVLHDIGKIKEYEYQTSIDYSDEGRLLSHIVIGLQMINEKAGKIKNFPVEELLLLKHMIVSHHGTREFGSPEPPKTIEAVLLNYIDEIDSKVNGIRDFISSEDNNETWTSYHRILGRYFYMGKKNQ